MVGGGGFEPPNPKEQIYSLPRLATSLLAHKSMSALLSMVDAKSLELLTSAV